MVEKLSKAQGPALRRSITRTLPDKENGELSRGRRVWRRSGVHSANFMFYASVAKETIRSATLLLKGFFCTGLIYNSSVNGFVKVGYSRLCLPS